MFRKPGRMPLSSCIGVAGDGAQPDNRVATGPGVRVSWNRRNTASTLQPTATPTTMPAALPATSIHWEVRVGTQRWATSSTHVYAHNATAAAASRR